jgi:hypothetical protein
MDELLAELFAEFGWKARLAATFGGPYVAWRIRREEKRLAKGWTYEPPTFYEQNAACEPTEGASPCRYVEPATAATCPAPNEAATA